MSDIAGDFGPETPEVNPQAPDPRAAQERIAAFEHQHRDVLMDPNHPGRATLLREGSKLYAGAYGADPETGLDVSSDGPMSIEPGDHAGAIGRVFERYAGPSAEATAFAGGACRRWPIGR
jgi:hypothetical protein